MNDIDKHVRSLKLKEALDWFGTGCATSTIEFVLREPEKASERARILADEYKSLQDRLDLAENVVEVVIEHGRTGGSYLFVAEALDAYNKARKPNEQNNKA